VNSKLQIGVLGSTRGTILLPLIDKLERAHCPFDIATVISNSADAEILKRAQEKSIPSYVISPDNLSREAFDQAISQKLEAEDVELVVLIGYMRILSPWFIQQWQQRIYNIHPSLLPDFGGKMDQGVHQAVLDAGVKETGCTVHIVNEFVDGGPIILQKRCPVYPDDDVHRLKQRVQACEVDALADAIQHYHLENVYA